MAITEQERAAAAYLSTIEDEDDRRAAAGRITQLVRNARPDAESALRPPVAPFREYREREFETPPFLLPHGQLVRGELHALIARAGKGKTTLTMNRIVKWAAGQPLFLERADDQTPVEGPMKIVMLQNEGIAFFMQEKLDGLAKALGPDGDALVDENLFIWGDGGYSNFKVDKEHDLELLRRALETVQPDALTLEPFRGIWRGEENDSTAMEAVLDDLAAIAHEYQVAIMIGHHEKKGQLEAGMDAMDRSRGSGNFEGKVAVMENLRSVKDGEYTELTFSKRRYSTEFMPLMRMQFNHATWALEYVPENQIADDVLTTMNEDPAGWYTKEELAEALGETITKVNEALGSEAKTDTLIGQGRIIRRKGDRGGFKYRLKVDGMAAKNNGGLDV